jgi:hypothetical protein
MSHNYHAISVAKIIIMAEGVSDKLLFSSVRLCLNNNLKINELTDEVSVHVRICLL